MSTHADTHRNDHHVTAPRTVRQIAVPPAARGFSTLSRIDYADAFLLQTDPAQEWTAEHWARAILEDAPAIMRRKLGWGWFALGLKLGSTQSDRFVLGWEVRRTAPKFALLGASSRLGMPAELLSQRHEDTLLLATFVQQQNPIARAMWTAVAPQHRQVVPYLLGRATRHLSSGEPALGGKANRYRIHIM